MLLGQALLWGSWAVGRAALDSPAKAVTGIVNEWFEIRDPFGNRIEFI